MPSTGRDSVTLSSLVFEDFSDQHSELPKFLKTCAFLPIQVDLEQQLGHWLHVLQKTIE